MKLDAQLLVSDAQALTASGASTSYIDIGQTKNLFDGEPLALVLVVDVAADHTTGDETYQFDLQGDDNTGFSSPATLASRTIAATSLTAASKHVIPVPVGTSVERYVRLYATLGGTTPSITFTAFLMPQSMIQKDKVYAKGYTVS